MYIYVYQLSVCRCPATRIRTDRVCSASVAVCGEVEPDSCAPSLESPADLGPLSVPGLSFTLSQSRPSTSIHLQHHRAPVPYIPPPPSPPPLRPAVAPNSPPTLLAALALLGAHPEPSQATLRQHSELSPALALAHPAAAAPSNKARAARCSTQLNSRAQRNPPTPVYTPIDTAIAPGHCSRLRLETKGNRGLAPTTARAGFGAHLQ